MPAEPLLTMDAIGARELRKRLDDQAHWREAEAVQDGRQSPTDPDFLDLDGTADGVRHYRLEQEQTTIDGKRAVVTSRKIKTLTDGYWETSYLQESVEYLDEA